MASKKANKNETEGNILTFYALQNAISTVFNTDVSANSIVFKSGVKGQAQYKVKISDDKLDNKTNKLLDEPKKQLLDTVNNLLSSNTKISCQESNDNDGERPNGIRKDCQLYTIKMNDNLFGVSHVPITYKNLGIFHRNFFVDNCVYY